MITIITPDRIVKTRKPHVCCYCGRKFPEGSIMHFQVNKVDDIYSIYICETCHELTDKFPFEFMDDYYEFPQFCVAEHPDRGDKTPEEFLQWIKTKELYERL